jgi:hypothetical protein
MTEADLTEADLTCTAVLFSSVVVVYYKTGPDVKAKLVVR